MGNTQSNGTNSIGPNDIHAHYDNFYLNFASMTVAYVGIFIWDYYTMAWASIMYTFGFPIFFV